jgi:hypothetical protein
MRDLKIKGLKVVISIDKEEIRPFYIFCFYWFLLDEACNSAVVNENISKSIRRFH